MASSTRILVFNATPAVSECKLSVPGSIGGSVRNDATESGLPEVTVRLWDATWKLVASVRSDAAGTFAFEGTPPGGYIVSVDMPLGFEAREERATIRVVSKGQVRADFRLRPAHQLRGRIVDAKFGTGMSGVDVSLRGSSGLEVASGRTTDKGDFAFAKLAADSYKVHLRT